MLLVAHHAQVVFGGWLYKKGEMNTALQLRWFLLSDEPSIGGAILRYYEGDVHSSLAPALLLCFAAPSSHLKLCTLALPLKPSASQPPGRNTVTRTLKGEIRITPQDVSMVCLLCGIWSQCRARGAALVC